MDFGVVVDVAGASFEADIRSRKVAVAPSRW